MGTFEEAAAVEKRATELEREPPLEASAFRRLRLEYLRADEVAIERRAVDVRIMVTGLSLNMLVMLH